MAAANDGATCPLTADHIHPQGDFAFPAIPGKPFAKLKKNDLPELAAEYLEAYLTCDLKGGTVSATTVGMVSISGKGLSITPLWKISEDRMSLTMDFYPKDCFDTAISDDNYRDWLPKGCKGVDHDALDEAVAEAKKTEAPVKDVAIAKGRESADGRNGTIQLKFREGNDVGKVKEDGSIDFRERGGTTCVEEGDLIATLVPPTTGKPGHNVLGEELPAQDGQPQALKSGTGVTTSDTGGGTVEFKAASPGMVVYKEGTISISDVLEINSDVDLASGNVHVEKGSILIKGTVTTGTEVTAKENVVVDVVVENATVKAGADITVGGGILMDDGGLIEAGGNVTAKFIRNATVRAGGDVIVEVDFVNCDIIAGGRIIAESDKGIANGGTYVCGGMNVAEVGTDGGATTDVTLTLPETGGMTIDEKFDRVLAKVDELEKYIGAEDIKSTLLMAPKEDRAILAELFKIKAKLMAKAGKLKTEKDEQLKAQGKELAKIKLKARKTAHAGSTIHIGGKSIKLTKAEQASRFHWDAEKGGIAISGI